MKIKPKTRLKHIREALKAHADGELSETATLVAIGIIANKQKPTQADIKLGEEVADELLEELLESTLGVGTSVICPACGDNRIGKGSLIADGGQCYCNESCYELAHKNIGRE